MDTELEPGLNENVKSKIIAYGKSKFYTARVMSFIVQIC